MKFELIFDINPGLDKIGLYNWKYSDYLFWKNRRFKINYLLIFSNLFINNYFYEFMLHFFYKIDDFDSKI